MRRTTTTAALAAGLALLAPAVPAQAAAEAPRVLRTAAVLTDLQPGQDDPTDGALARAAVVTGLGGATVAVLAVRGLDRAAAGRTFGTHVHVGPCVEGDGAAAGPHFNIEAHAGDGTPEVSPRTEVWLDVRATRWGTGVSVARVPFDIPEGAAASVVLHAQPTAEDGSAGARLACLPLEM